MARTLNTRWCSPLEHAQLFFLSSLLVLFAGGALSAQQRDLRSGRLFLDDNGADGNGTHSVLLTAPALQQHRTLLLPDRDGILLLSPATGFINGEILFGGSDGTISSAATIVVDSADGALQAERFSDGTASLEDGDLTGVGEVAADPAVNLTVTSNRSIVLNIDDDDDGTGSSFAVETNGNSADLLRVTETGLTTIRSTSNSGGLRVESNASSSSAEILELRDGSTARLVVRRNGDVGIGDDTPDARLDLESDDPNDPALLLAQRDPDGVALQIDEGSLRLSHGVGTNTTIPADLVLWTVADNGLAGSGLSVALPAGAEGSILYVYYADQDPGSVGGHAVVSGDRLTLLFVAGAWRLF